jgi:ABC-type multidrug transport system ATPase subunit
MSEGARLTFDSYGKKFGERPVLHSASLWGTPGKTTALLGRNGTGKSTLIRAGLGLTRSDHGTTRWEGEVMVRPRLHELARRGLFFLPDHGLLSLRLRLRDQIDLFASAQREDPTEVVEDFRLGSLMDLRAGELSGGETRRSELALARLRAPSCLIADEPFLGLGPLDRALVAAELKRHVARGAAVIVTGHEVSDLLRVADQVVWMVAGTTHALGDTAAALEHGQFRREYLGWSATAELA